MILTMTKIPMVFAEGICTLAPNDRRTVCTLAAPISGDVAFALDPSNCRFGDELVLILSRIENENLNITFPTESFVLTVCSEAIVGPFGLESEDDITEWMFQFFFDGTKFLSTVDLG